MYKQQQATHTAKNPTRCNSVSKCIIPYLYKAQHVSGYQNLLFLIYMKLNMFRATHRPSSGA
jgi:hypothetical protein